MVTEKHISNKNPEYIKYLVEIMHEPYELKSVKGETNTQTDAEK